MVHVEVNNGHPLEVVPLQCIFGSNGHVVEKTKPHGLVVASMVTGRTHGAKSRFHFAGQHRVNRIDGGPGSVQRSVPGVHVDTGVRINL
ncbi:hypothetical protein GALL_541220 [mine drainage metagenome]|uniref:Uncharacterized protein n=1 Tax=mine drainage metagenome TaxID=410659 RepID=A0A1J5P946_9ZZZZ